MTVLSKVIYVKVEGGYALFIIFILNVVAVFFCSGFFNKTPVVKDKNVEYDYNEKSVTIFIKLMTYFMPILLLIGLYFVNMTKILDIDSASNWVSFILAIVAFAMSLISLYQGETTFKKMMDILTEIKEKTNRTSDILTTSQTAPKLSPPSPEASGGSSNPKVNVNLGGTITALTANQGHVAKSEEPDPSGKKEG